MKSLDEKKAYESHLFVCTNVKDGAKSCGACGGSQIRDSLKAKANQKKQWMGKVRVNASGCLGHCEEGPVAVLYPAKKWFTEISEKDVDSLLLEIEKSLVSR